MQNSVNHTKKNNKINNSDIEKDKLMEFRQIVCWLSLKHYQVLVNTFAQYFVTKINYCISAFSLLLSIVLHNNGTRYIITPA